jgi:hypothetical protein
VSVRGASFGGCGTARGRGVVFVLGFALGGMVMSFGACVEERVIYNRPFLGGLPGSQTGDVVTPPAGMLEEVQSGAVQRIKVDNEDGSVTLHSRTARHLMIHIHNLLDERPVAKSALAERKRGIRDQASGIRSGESGGGRRAMGNGEGAEERGVGHQASGIKGGEAGGGGRDRGKFETVAAVAGKAPTNEEIFTEQVLSTVTKDEFYANGKQPEEAYKWLRDARDEIDELFALMPMGESTPGMYLKRLGGNVYRLEVPAEVRKGLKFRGMDMVMEKGNWRLRWFVQ